jgi:hypothetical protein
MAKRKRKKYIRKPPKPPKFMIVLMLNNKRKKIVESTNDRATIDKLWTEYKTQKPPIYCIETKGRTRAKQVYEMVLIYPYNKEKAAHYTKVYKKDELGRNQPIEIESDGTHRIKAIIPWYLPETIYDSQEKKHIYYEEFYDKINRITDTAQIFTLNAKIIVQIEDNVMMYQNKNLNDTSRLFDILKEMLLKNKRRNFLFIKDITSYQRSMLYEMLTAKGYNKRELFRHYSY